MSRSAHPLFVLTLLVPVAAAAPKSKDAAKPPATPEGRWAFERYVRNGVALDGGQTADLVLVLTAMAATLEAGGRPLLTEGIEYRVAAGAVPLNQLVMVRIHVPQLLPTDYCRLSPRQL